MEENEPKTQGSNSMFLVGGIIALVVIVGGAILLMNSGSTSQSVTQDTSLSLASPSASAAVTPNPSEPTAIESDKDAKTFNIEAGSFYYKPNEIKVKKGDTVKVVLKAGDMMHDFNINELGVKIPVTKAGNTAEVTFVAEKAGEYEFYCSVGSHKQQGQVGTLIVE